jgi:transglutaminase-like putative cysteine protease
MRRCTALSLLVLLSASPLRAQAPRITSAGDTSVRSDTIYRLAVAPSGNPDAAAVLLLDDGVVRYELDGTGVQTYRQVTQILSPDAVEDYAEHEFSYSPGHQRLTVNWIRVVRPDGTLISEAPTQVQDADIPASLGDPVYSDTKVRRYSLRGVAPGTIVDWSYTVEEAKPFLAGDFLLNWRIQSGRLTRRSRYILDLPAAMRPHLIEYNLNFKRRETTAQRRRIYRWAAQDIPHFQPEEFMPDGDSGAMSLSVSAPITWEDIGVWYAGLSKDRYGIDRAMRERIRTLLHSAASPDDSLRAVQRWVAQDIRYVSIALGLGGYQPRLPSEVVASGYGDCKDKATLFVAVARSLGFRAYPVLLNAGGPVDRRLPSIQQFNHAIAVIERPEGRVYLDLTADLVPYGELPESDQGQFGLIVYPDGTSEQVTLPQAAPEDNLNRTVIRGVLSTDGYVTASYEESGQGSRQGALRSLFLAPIDSLHRVQFARSIATKIFPGAEGDSLETFDGRDLLATPRVSLRIIHGVAARSTGGAGTMILSLPFPSMRGMADAAGMLQARGTRRYPIDAAKVIGPWTTETELRLALPSGWAVHLPPSIEVTGRWGSYTSRYQQEGDTLLVTRRLQGARGVYPPSALGDLADWLRNIARDDVPYLAIEPRATP